MLVVRVYTVYNIFIKDGGFTVNAKEQIVVDSVIEEYYLSLTEEVDSMIFPTGERDEEFWFELNSLTWYWRGDFRSDQIKEILDLISQDNDEFQDYRQAIAVGLCFNHNQSLSSFKQTKQLIDCLLTFPANHHSYCQLSEIIRECPHWQWLNYFDDLMKIERLYTDSDEISTSLIDYCTDACYHHLSSEQIAKIDKPAAQANLTDRFNEYALAHPEDWQYTKEEQRDSLRKMRIANPLNILSQLKTSNEDLLPNWLDEMVYSACKTNYVTLGSWQKEDAAPPKDIASLISRLESRHIHFLIENIGQQPGYGTLIDAFMNDYPEKVTDDHISNLLLIKPNIFTKHHTENLGDRFQPEQALELIKHCPPDVAVAFSMQYPEHPVFTEDSGEEAINIITFKCHEDISAEWIDVHAKNITSQHIDNMLQHHLTEYKMSVLIRTCPDQFKKKHIRATAEVYGRGHTDHLAKTITHFFEKELLQEFDNLSTRLQCLLIDKHPEPEKVAKQILKEVNDTNVMQITDHCGRFWYPAQIDRALQQTTSDKGRGFIVEKCGARMTELQINDAIATKSLDLILPLVQHHQNRLSKQNRVAIAKIFLRKNQRGKSSIK